MEPTWQSWVGEPERLTWSGSELSAGLVQPELPTKHTKDTKGRSCRASKLPSYAHRTEIELRMNQLAKSLTDFRVFDVFRGDSFCNVPAQHSTLSSSHD